MVTLGELLAAHAALHIGTSHDKIVLHARKPRKPSGKNRNKIKKARKQRHKRNPR